MTFKIGDRVVFVKGEHFEGIPGVVVQIEDHGEYWTEPWDDDDESEFVEAFSTYLLSFEEDVRSSLFYSSEVNTPEGMVTYPKTWWVDEEQIKLEVIEFEYVPTQEGDRDDDI